MIRNEMSCVHLQIICHLRFVLLQGREGTTFIIIYFEAFPYNQGQTYSVALRVVVVGMSFYNKIVIRGIKPTLIIAEI